MGAADQNSFAIAYNFFVAAQMLGQMWITILSGPWGTATGTFIDWVNSLCANAEANILNLGSIPQTSGIVLNPVHSPD